MPPLSMYQRTLVHTSHHNGRVTNGRARGGDGADRVDNEDSAGGADCANSADGADSVDGAKCVSTPGSFKPSSPMAGKLQAAICKYWQAEGQGS